MIAERARRAGTLLLLAFVATNAGYFFLDPEESRFAPWLALYSVQFALLFGMVRRGAIPLTHVITAGLVSRVALWFTVPVLEADYYRYLWDGHVLANGINPFLYPPEHPALDPIETDYRFFITHSQYSTIYPPVAQYVFWLAHAVAPDSLLGVKVVLTAFDLATGLVIVRWLAERTTSTSGAALYFLNPLVLKEIANSAHVDAVPVFFATAALYGMSRSAPRKLGAWLLLALSVGSKLYAVALAPLFARVDGRWLRNTLAAVVALALAYFPFAGAGAALFAGTAAFGQHWIFNASLFRIVALLWSAVLPEANLAPRITVAAVFAGLVAWRTFRLRDRTELPRAALFVLGAMLLLSPVVDAWYVLWILPVAVVIGSVPWLAFSYLVGFSYAWFHSPEAALVFGLLEYGTLYTLLLRRSATIVDA